MTQFGSCDARPVRRAAGVLGAAIAAVGTVLAPTFSAPVSAATGAVAGYVKDVSTNAVLVGATVKAAGKSAVTDSKGHYRIASIPVGQVIVAASAANYTSASASVSVARSTTTTKNFALSRTSASGPSSTIFWNGSSGYLLGVNYPWYNYGTDFGTGAWGKFTDWGAVSTAFAALNSQGVRVVRWWLFADGRYSPEFNADGTVSGLDANVLPDIDQALQAAANNNEYILFTVIDNSIWNDASYNGGIQMGGHAAMVTDATAQQSFLDNALKPVLQHVAASPNARRVLGYDIVNEPEGNMSGYWGGVNLQPSQVQTFVQRSASYIHTYGGGAYATVGSATPYYVGTWKGLGLDFYEIHYYPWMDFSNGAGSGLPTYASLGLDKPCIVGEFATADASYGTNDTNVQSARWYLDTIYKNGYAGALGWSYAGGDSASNWTSFQPVLTAWYQTYQSFIGPK